jgi:hypothetical protein
MLTQVSDPIIVGENAQFLATNDEFVWKIIVTPEALVALTRDSSTPISAVLLYIEVFTRIADANLSKVDAILDETVWVLQADVEAWLSSQATRWKRRRQTGAASRRVGQGPLTAPVHPSG